MTHVPSLARPRVPVLSALLAVAALLLTLLVAAPAQAATGTVSGIAQLPSGEQAPAGQHLTVSLQALTPDETTYTAQANPTSGAWSIGNVPEGDYMLWAYYSEWGAYSNIYWPGTTKSSEMGTFHVSGGAQSVAEPLVLQHNGTVVGRVVDETGAPVPDASVSLFNGVDSTYTTTGADGRYAFPRPVAPGPGVSPFQPYQARLMASFDSQNPADGPVLRGSDSIETHVDFGNPTVVDLTMEHQPVVRFTVKDAQGNPIPNPQVRVKRPVSAAWGGGLGNPQYGDADAIQSNASGQVGIMYEGPWTVEFLPPAGSDLVPEYWGGEGVNVFSRADATVVSNAAGESPAIRDYTVQLGTSRGFTPGTPTVSGTVKMGHTLVADPGTWPAGTELSYQWYNVLDAPIPGATEPEYTIDASTPIASEFNWDPDRFTVRVTGRRAGQPAVDAESAPVSGTLVKDDPKPVEYTRPTVDGTAKVGSTLTAQPGQWGPQGVTLAYQWNVAGAPVSGATASTFAPRATDVDKPVTVTVTGSAPGRVSVSRTSAATGNVTRGALVAGTPTISGTAQVGETLTAQSGTWGPEGVELGYQWFGAGLPIEGETGETLTLTEAHLGYDISVQVTGTLGGYTDESRTSARTQHVVAAPVEVVAGAVRVSGTPQTGRTLTAWAENWQPGAGLVMSYQWLADGRPITGATGSSWKVTNAVAGKRISVRATGRFDETSTAVQSSDETAPSVGLITPAKPKIKGKLKVGKKLKVVAGDWKPGSVKLRYTWLRNGKVIKGATKASYKLTKKDRRKKISVRVTATKTHYATVVRTSAKTTKVR